MNVTPVAGATRALTTPLAGATVPAFGQALALVFVTGAGADGLALEGTAAALKGRFAPYDYDGRGGAGEFAAMIAQGQAADTVIVRLPARRYVRQVWLAPRLANAGDAILLYRVDQDVPAGQPVAAAGDRGDLDADFAESSFAIRLNRGGDGSTFANLAPADIVHLYLRSYPTTPRLGLPDPTQPGKSVFFWQQAGEVITPDAGPQLSGQQDAGARRVAPAGGADLPAGRTMAAAAAAQPALAARATIGGKTTMQVTGRKDMRGIRGLRPGAGAGHKTPAADAGKVDAGAVLAGALQRLFDRQPTPLPATGMTIDLVVASDTPCTFTIESLALPYHLKRTTFPTDPDNPDGTGKQVLRFAGGTIAAQQVSVTLPGNATPASATLQALPNLRPGGVAAGDELAGLNDQLASAEGVYLGGSEWAGQPFAPAAALNADGVALGLLALAAPSEIAVAIHADWQGQPAGKPLAAGTITLAEAGARAWASARFAAGVVLPAQPAWLLLKARRGQAIWLAQRGPTPDRMEVLEQPAANGPWAQHSAIPGLAALYRLFAAQAGGQPPLVLSLAGQTVSPTAGAGDTLTFDLTAALNTYLSAHRGPGAVSIPLTFTSGAAGSITVYPPAILYDLY